MVNHPAAPLLLLRGDREKPSGLVRSTSARARLAQRARIVVLAAERTSNTDIAEKVGTSRTTVIARRARYTEAGLDGLADHDLSGRPGRFDHRAIVAAALQPPLKRLGVTHWSSRLSAAAGELITARWRRPGGGTE